MTNNPPLPWEFMLTFFREPFLGSFFMMPFFFPPFFEPWLFWLPFELADLLERWLV